MQIVEEENKKKNKKKKNILEITKKIEHMDEAGLQPFICAVQCPASLSISF